MPPQSKSTKYSFEDAAHFKNVLMQLICKGETVELENLLRTAPAFKEYPEFTDYKTFKFSMFKKDVGEFMESKVCSPLAIAVCSGDLKMIELIFAYMTNVDIEFGL